MMPVGLKLVLIIILSIALFGGFIYIINHMMNHWDEWAIWKIPENLDEDDEEE